MKHFIPLLLVLSLSGCSGCLVKQSVKKAVDKVDIDMSLDWVSTGPDGNEHKVTVFVLDDVEEIFFGDPLIMEPEEE